MELHSIENGNFLYDGGALFGVVPKLAWNSVLPANADNLCSLALRMLLVKTQDHVILIDAGVGNKFADEMAQFGFSGVQPMEQVLKPFGVSCNQVTDLVLTSLHFQHAGGCTSFNEEQNICLTFPNATVYVGEEQWKTVLNPSEREKCLFFTADFMEVLKQDKLQVLKSDIELCPGVSLRLFNGFSAAQIVPFVKSEDQTYIFAGELIPTVAHLSLDWLDAHAVQPLVALQSKQTLLQQAANTGARIVFCNDPSVQWASVALHQDFEPLLTGSFV